MTTSSFTSAAKDRANELDVKLVDGVTLATMIDDLDAYDLVAAYLGYQDTPNSEPERSGAQETTREFTGGQVSEGYRTAPEEITPPSTERPSESEEENSVNSRGVNASPVERNDVGEPKVAADIGNWHYGIIGCIALIFAASTLGIDGLGGLLALILPLLVYVDSYNVSKASTGWNPRRWLYAIASLISFVGPPIYLYDRWRKVGL